MDSSTTTTDDECKLGNVQFSDVFTNLGLIFLCMIVAVSLTAPALTVYLRNTEEKPMKSYFYSCCVKFIVGFMATNVIVGDLFLLYQNDECDGRISLSVPFIADFATETVEFLFDFSRLVLFWADPGKIDFYQNVR